MNRPSRFLTALALAASTFVADAATIVVVNGDPPNVGFNDPTAADPVGKNTGTTLGQQRLNVYQAVAAKWGAELTSSVPIVVYATWEPLACDESAGVLGAAGTVFINSNFPNALFPDTWYNSALANKLATTDLIPEDPTSSDPVVKAGADIRALFNVNLGTAGCLPDSPFYLGLDNNHGTAIDFYSVLLHELGHGLGFQVITDAKSGRRIGNPALPSMWERFMLDNDSGLTWFQMTTRQRKQSAVNFRGLVWNGNAVTAESKNVLSYGTAEAIFNTSPPQTFAVGTAEYGPALTNEGVTAVPATITRQRGEVGPGCSAYDAGNAAAVAGRIALVDRGGCTFVIKSKNAQNAGAVAVVIANNVAGGAVSPAGSDPTFTFTIPTVGVSKDDGATIKAALRRNSPTLTLHLNMSLLAGADASRRVFLYTPDAFEGGSSVSHWDTSATRNLLMEPFINDDLEHAVMPPYDLTLQLFIDIGW
jgi:hypothetical protein